MTKWDNKEKSVLQTHSHQHIHHRFNLQMGYSLAYRLNSVGIKKPKKPGSNLSFQKVSLFYESVTMWVQSSGQGRN